MCFREQNKETVMETSDSRTNSTITTNKLLISKEELLFICLFSIKKNVF
jgi:hypothetical protein